MDNTLYAIITPIISILAFIIFVALIIAYLITKRKFRNLEVIIIAVLCVCMYLIIPYKYHAAGVLTRNEAYLNKALKLSINPFEKKQIYYSLVLFIYDDFSSLGADTRDGNKAIEIYEKLLNKNSDKNNFFLYRLSYLYFLKGDYDKSIKIQLNAKKQDKSVIAWNYIMKNDYNKALLYQKEKRSEEKLLKADLYRHTGENKTAYDLKNEALSQHQKEQNANRNKIEDSKEVSLAPEYKDCQSVETFKNWVKEQKTKYKFNE